MDEEKARQILSAAIQEDNTLQSLGWYVSWPSYNNEDQITIDAECSLEDLEAIVWWMKNKRSKPNG